MFGLMVAGYLLARIRAVEAAGIRGLATFVFLLAIPATLFRGVATGIVPGNVSLDIVYAYFLGLFAVYGISLRAGRALFDTSLPERALLALSASFSNSVMLGIPLVIGAFGERAVLPVTLVISFHSLILIPLTTLLVEIGRGERTSLPRMAATLGRALVGNPIIVAIAAGFAWALTGWQMPTAVDAFTRLLAAAAPACALFALGASLAGYRIGGDLRETAFLVAMKLFLHPAIVWLLAGFVFRLPPIEVAVATMLAALPTGANAFILAQRYGIYIARAATGVLVTTGLSIVTAAVLLSLFGALR